MCRLAGCVLLLVGVAAFADDTDPEPVSPPEAELKKLQGGWDLVKIVRDGKDETNQKKGGYFVIQRNQLLIKDNGRDEKATITLDPKKKPAHIDIKPGNEGQFVKGIYKLQKDELTIAFGDPGQERPKDFDGKGIRGLLVLKREKPK